MYFKINNQDFSSFVSGLKVGFETLVSDESGRNANGDTVLDIVNRKRKVYITFRPMTDTEMDNLLAAMENYVVTVSFLDPKSRALTNFTAYTGTPEPEYYTIQTGHVLYKPMSLNFIEL